MATPRVPLVLALHGEPDRLVSKPETYAELLQLARKPTIFFNQLNKFKDEEITFRFTWDDTEVVLDESAFDFVQARARLRIITPDRASPIKIEHLSSSPRPALASEPTPKRVKVEGLLDGQHRVEIDLTMDETSLDEPTVAQEEESLPMVENPEDVQRVNNQPNDAESQVATQNVEPSPLQAVAIRRLTAHNFAVSAGSPNRTVPPQRQLIPHQWVNCREPWPEEVSGPHLGKFTIRVLTEHNIVPCTFTSDLVHVGTLKKYLQDRGYPSDRPSIPGTYSDDMTLARCNITEGSDVYVSRRDKPGIYFLPPRGVFRNKGPTMPVSVTLELCLGSKFESLYPWTTIRAVDDIETAEWKVSLNMFGDTFSNLGPEKYFGHLSWIATVDTAFRHQAEKVRRFNRARQRLHPRDCVVLKREDLQSWYMGGAILAGGRSYLREVLAGQLGLPHDIAQDFQAFFDVVLRDSVQNWDDRFSIAIKFLPQKDIEEAARLNITPRPDTTVRVCMVFGVVDTGKSKLWGTWAGRMQNFEDKLKAKNWAEITGIQPKALDDSEKFRAIEWSVMQVHGWHQDVFLPECQRKRLSSEVFPG